MNINLEENFKTHSPGYIIEIYNNGHEEEIVLGNRETKPFVKECNKNTLYDIASLTKTYTAILVYMAYEEGLLNINAYVKSIDEHFVYLDKVTILDLLSHNQEIWTDGYLGSAKSRNEFYEILFTSYVKNEIPTYVDTHYIILSTILEGLYNKPFATLLEEKIFKRLNLKDTTINPKGNNIASNNYETLNGKIIDFIKPGLIHDTKGRVAKELEITTGHASIFTTGHDLLVFLKSFFDCTLLKEETIKLMLEHQDRNKLNYNILKEIVSLDDDVNVMTKKALEINSNLKLVRTYNNMGTRYRNNIQALNDIPANCSENSITFSGYTGPSYLIDFDRKIIIVVMCNVMHNTKLDRYQRKHITDNIIESIYNQISE